MDVGRAPTRKLSPVAALAATTTVGYGALFYAYGVLLLPMQHDLGWSRSFLSGAFSAGLVVAALLTVPVGRWLDRHEPRALFLLAAAAATALVVGWSRARTSTVFLLAWLGIGACQAVLFYDAAFTVLTKRFHGWARNRAITSVTLVAGLASTIFGPLTAFLEHSLGWRDAVAVLALIVGVVTLPAFVFGLGRRGAADVEPPPRAEVEPEPEPEVPGPESAHPRQAVHSRPFWLLTVAYLLSAVTTYAVAVHLVPYLRGRGLSTGAAASVLGAVGLVQVLGRGAFLRFSAGRRSVDVASWVLAAKALGLSLLLLVPGWGGAVLLVLVYGSANGAATLTRATTVAELYGPQHYGTIAGVIAAVSAMGGAVAPFLFAAAADLAGADGPVLGALVALSVVAAAANAMVARTVGPGVSGSRASR